MYFNSSWQNRRGMEYAVVPIEMYLDTVNISMYMSHKLARIAAWKFSSLKAFLRFNNVCFLLFIRLNRTFQLIGPFSVSVLSFNVFVVKAFSCNYFRSPYSACYNNLMWFNRRRISDVARLSYVLVSVHLAHWRWLVFILLFYVTSLPHTRTTVISFIWFKQHNSRLTPSVSNPANSTSAVSSLTRSHPRMSGDHD